VSRRELRSEVGDNDAPAGRRPAATDYDTFEVAVVDEVTLGSPDDAEAVVGEGGELGATKPVAELS